MSFKLLEKLRANPGLAIVIATGIGFAIGLAGRRLRRRRGIPDVLILSAK